MEVTNLLALVALWVGKESLQLYSYLLSKPYCNAQEVISPLLFVSVRNSMHYVHKQPSNPLIGDVMRTLEGWKCSGHTWEVARTRWNTILELSMILVGCLWVVYLWECVGVRIDNYRYLECKQHAIIYHACIITIE